MGAACAAFGAEHGRHRTGGGGSYSPGEASRLFGRCSLQWTSVTSGKRLVPGGSWNPLHEAHRALAIQVWLPACCSGFLIGPCTVTLRHRCLWERCYKTFGNQRLGYLPDKQPLSEDEHTGAGSCHKRISSSKVSMNRTRALALPEPVKARSVKSLFIIALKAEDGGISEQHMKDLRAAARGALGKGAALRRSAALELMAHGGPIGDPRVAADLSTVRVWQRLAAGKVTWPLSA
eukprot:1371062-Amphidinium_carterae.1